MLERVTAASLLMAGIFGVSATTAISAELPAIQLSPSNSAAACATPGRLMSFVRERNPSLADKFSDISVHYMRIGQELGVRWDYAFYQMLVETGFLTYKGDVSVRQNNFAGIGATGGGVPGESFPSVAEGVRAHLQHLLMYAGVHVDNPVADRTRKVQEWRVLDKWRRSISGNVTYTHMTRKWSPGDRGYSNDINAVAERFLNGPCLRADPAPELIAGIRTTSPNGSEVATATREPSAGSRIAEKAVATARETGATTRSGLGARFEDKPSAPVTSITQNVSVINAQPDTTATVPASPSNSTSEPSVGRFASNLIAAVTPPPAKAIEPASCRVWTASYGGQKALIIKSVSASHVNYTVLDVNEGKEQREADAYIAAYAKGGKTVEEFSDPSKALAKAFEYCPSGNKAKS